MNDDIRWHALSAIKCKTAAIDMLNKTRDEMLERGLDTKKIDDEIKEELERIEEINKACDDGDESSIISALRYENEEVEPEELIRIDDFSVHFDGIDISGRYVNSINWDENDGKKTMYISVYDYMIDNQNGGFIKLLKTLFERNGQSIGDILFTYPSVPADDRSYVFKFTGCKLKSYYMDPFSKEMRDIYKYHSIHLEISYENVNIVE